MIPTGQRHIRSYSERHVSPSADIRTVSKTTCERASSAVAVWVDLCGSTPITIPTRSPS